ncbi:hypothetical protein ABT354_20165 [Streptomyces sp. NPDC000594]|uniref:hypothetical protein n=1 Tax=Streptomyces sp. NPDC000594 TaxID=3154261 RepID=UPI00332D2B93
MPPTRTLLLPIVTDALACLYELDMPLLVLQPNVLADLEESHGVVHALSPSLLPLVRRITALAPEGGAVPVPGAPVGAVHEAYWRVRNALPAGTEELVDGEEDELPDALMLLDPAGEPAMQLAVIEVGEADLALLGAFADALDRAAGPDPGPQFAALARALREIGRAHPYEWWPRGGAATVALWMRRALSPVLVSPFEGPGGAATHEMLSAILRHAGHRASVELDQDEEAAVGRVGLRMLFAAIGDPREAARTA